ncbi:MAG: YlxM family DNA-binding protein [Clostridia bacterium]|nr:YlxM family DNA-binding protein [Clostridia bacterium]
MDEKRFNTASEASRAEITLLLDFYGNALTERQRRTAELYFQEDLSLGEIAEMTGITRQGVRDGLKKAEKALFEYEERLGIAGRFLRQRKALEEAKHTAEELPDGEAKDLLLDKINAAIDEA